MDETLPSPPDLLHAIFVDTNIDTHLALVVSLHDTISDVKAKIKAEHAICFQDIGDIAVEAIKVKRRGFFYNLADSMPIRYAFDGVKGSWFISIDAVPKCSLKSQIVLPNKLAHEQFKNLEYMVPVSSGDKHKEIVFCGLSPKYGDASRLSAFISIAPVEHENQSLADDSLKELPAVDPLSLQNGRISPVQNFHILSNDVLTHVDKNIKILNELKTNEAHLGGVVISSCEPEKTLDSDQYLSHNPIVMSIGIENRPDFQINQDNDGKRMNNRKKLGDEASDAMPPAPFSQKTLAEKGNEPLHHKVLESEFQHFPVEKKRVMKLKDDYRTGGKFNENEGNDEPNKSEIVPQNIKRNEKKENFTTFSERSPSKLPHENAISLQNSSVERWSKKRKRKPSNSHEEAHLVMPPGVASILPENFNEPDNDKSIPNDGDTAIEGDATKFLKVSIQNKAKISLDRNNEPTVERYQVNLEDHSERHVNQDQETSVDASLNGPEEARISSRITSKISSKSYCSSERLPSKLPHDASISLQNSPVEKHARKKKRKAFKLHEEALPLVPTEPKVDESSLNNGVMGIVRDTANLLKVFYPVAVNNEPKDQSEKHMNSSQETTVNVSLKEPVEAKISPSNLYCSSEGLAGKSLHESTVSFQNFPVEKCTMKRVRKSSKSDEAVHHVMPTGAAAKSSTELITCLQDPNLKETRNSMEINNEPIDEVVFQAIPEDQNEKHVTLDQESNIDANLKPPDQVRISSLVSSDLSSKLHRNSVGLTNKLSHVNNMSLQSFPVVKHTKKIKKKASNFHEDTHLVIPSETKVVRSLQVMADSQNLRKGEKASVSSGKLSSGLNVNESLLNDDRYMSTKLGSAQILEAANQKEIRHSMEVNKERFGEQVFQLNTKGQNNFHVDWIQENDADVSIKEPEEARISSKAASEFPAKLHCSTDKVMSHQSSKMLKHMEGSVQQSRAYDATKCITDGCGSVDAKAGTFALSEKLPYQEPSSIAVSNQEGSGTGDCLTKADYKHPSKPQHRRKKSKAGSSKVDRSAELTGNKDHFPFVPAQVFSNEFQIDSNAVKSDKQADKKSDGGHNIDTMIKASLSSKNVSDQAEVSNSNSGNHLISLPFNSNRVSNAHVEQVAEEGIPSLTEAQAKPRSRKKPKAELSKLEPQEICDNVLANGRSDPSKHANVFNQKIEPNSVYAKVMVPQSDENSSIPVDKPQVNPLDPTCYELQDLCKQSNSKITIDGHVAQHEALADPPKSKRDKKKSKKEELNLRVSSEMTEHNTDLRKFNDSTINFHDYFAPGEGKHSSNDLTADLPSMKSVARKSSKSSRKIEMSQSIQESPTNFVHSSLIKQNVIINQPHESDSNQDLVDAVHDTAAKDSKTGIAGKGKNAKHSSKQSLPSGAIVSGSSPNNDKKLQNYGPPEPEAVGSKRGKKTPTDRKRKVYSLSPDQGVDNMVSRGSLRYKDPNSSNNLNVSLSEGMAASSDSTEDSPNKTKMQFKIVRKIPTRKLKKTAGKADAENELLAYSGRIFSDASDTSSEREIDAYKRKLDIKTSFNGLDNQHEEAQRKTSSMVHQMDTNSSGVDTDSSGSASAEREQGEFSKQADDGIENHSRSTGSVSAILKSSSHYRKVKISASQSEFPDTESQPIDVVLETQPESDTP